MSFRIDNGPGTQRRILSAFLAFAGVAAAVGILPPALLAADRGITDGEILIGQCAALTGPTRDLGIGINSGLKAALDQANARGGVFGRKIRLVADDDGYDPDRTVDCTGKMIEDKGVFALAGYVGTPTSKVAAPMVQEYKVPLVGLFTGAMLLRDPVQRYVINIRASYDDETEALVEYLTAKRAFSRIAVFYQNDSFGLAGLSGTEKALTRRKSTRLKQNISRLSISTPSSPMRDITTLSLCLTTRNMQSPRYCWKRQLREIRKTRSISTIWL